MNPSVFRKLLVTACTGLSLLFACIPAAAQDQPEELSPPINLESANGRVATLDAPSDIWDRIRTGFAMPDLETDQVRDREVWYSSRPDYLYRMTERSRRYLFHIVEELELRGMPTELALLPLSLIHISEPTRPY